MAEWMVYLLRCKDNSLYCGITNNLPRRLRAHTAGKVKYTRGRQPLYLQYWEEATDKRSALRREAAIKKLSKAAKEQMIVDMVERAGLS